ncbi:7-carboxy-7-deazaguanine synthase QueE [Thiomicrolovo sp. ZZH C-3]
MLYLVEHFYSIQGEGRYTGVPSLFFRFGGCNMRCEGFACSETAANGVTVTGCDTVYAVNKQHFGEQWLCIEHMDELITIMNGYTLPPHVDIVMTGGEPLIYAENEVFTAFVRYLVDRGHRVTFETNGAMPVDFERFPVYRDCVFALSVKLSNSGEPLEKRVRPNAFVPIAAQAKEAYFKFTIDRDSIGENMEHEIDEIVAHAPQLQVYCMPMGGSRAEIEANTEAVIDFCKARGYTYSDRLHIRIWDANKGV